MNKDELKQDFFISEDGYINIRLKVTTEDESEREKLIGELMGRLSKSNGFDLSKSAIVDQLYFYNQNPLTALKYLKKQMIEEMESMFDRVIEQN